MLTSLKPTRGSSSPHMGGSSVDRDQLRRDRWTAVAVMAVTMALMALLVWLASIGGRVPEGIEYWHVMP